MVVPEGGNAETRGARYRLPAALPPHFILSDTDRGCEYTTVCLSYLAWATGVSRHQISDIRRPRPVVDRGGGRALQMVKMSVQVWLIAMASLYLIAPDSDHTYLPFNNKEYVYQMYSADVDPVDGVLECERSYFLRVWRHNPVLKKIKIHKWSKFTHCDDCEEFRTNKIKAGRDRRKMVVIRRDEAKHHLVVTNERGYYGERIYKTRVLPHLYLCINIDAADQAAYGYPYFHRQSKLQSSVTKFKSHLMAAIVHGRATYAWTFCDNIEHGNNLTVECLHRIFEDQAMKNGGKLPEKLFLQMDNTAKQCKGNIYLRNVCS
jgi:hypothetical protein